MTTCTDPPRHGPGQIPRGGASSVLTGLIVLVAASLPPGTAAQTPDSASAAADTLDHATDSTRQQVFTLTGLTVNVARSITTPGGTSGVEVRLDSINVVPAPSLEQVLRTMPLIYVRENSRGEAQPSLRGSEERQIAVLVDGVPLTYGWDNRTDMSIIPLTAAENVRLIRGLSSVLHGPNVLGGVVEVDVSGGDRPLTRPQPLVLQGGVDQTGSATLAVTGGTLLGSNWVVRGGGGYRERQGYPVSDHDLGTDVDPTLLRGDDDLRLNSDIRHIDGFATARLQADGGSWLSLGGSGYSTERGVPPEVNESEPRLWRYPDQHRFLAAVSGGTGHRETGWGEGDLEASVGVDLQHFTIDEYGSAAYDDVVGGETGDTRTLSLRLLGDHSVGERGQFRASFTYGDVAHEEVIRPEGQRFDYRQRLWSLGAEGDWRVGDGGGTSFSAGLAIDGADTPESGDKPPLGSLWDWGGRVGLSSLVSPSVLLHASLSRRTRFPSLRELYSGALGRFLPNPELRPESLLGSEVGVTIRGAAGEFQAVGFHHRVEDGIVRASVDTGNGVLRQRINQNRVRATGLELLTSGSFGWLDFTGDLTLQRVRWIDADGETVPAEYQPDVLGKVGLGGDLPWDLYWNATGRAFGSQVCTTTSAALVDTLDAGAALDLGLRRIFQVGRVATLGSLDVLAAVDNVTDSAYYDQCGLPQPGRRLRIQFRLF